MTKEYKRRLKLLLKSKLNGRNIRAINTWAVAVIRNPAGILDWTKEQMRNMDRKTLKMMAMNGMLHPRANGSRLCLPRDGGRGLTSVKETIETEEYRLSGYVEETNKGHNRLLKSVEQEDTKIQEQQGQHQGTQNQRMDRKTTAWTIP